MRTDFWRKTNSIPSTVKPDYRLFKYIRPGSHVLDVGCGEGHLVLALGLLGYKATGIDVNTDAIKRARKKAQALGIDVNFIETDVCSITEDVSYDAVVMNAFMTVVSGMCTRTIVLERVRSITRPGGLLYIADFLQNWDIPLYRSRYEEGIQCGLERGSFFVRDANGSILYIAHHFEVKEIFDLVINSDYVIHDFSIEQFTTRSGNRVKGFILTAVAGTGGVEHKLGPPSPL